jgi:integrase
MAIRNYGLGNRDMARAGHNALRSRSQLSFSSIATIHDRWTQFCRWAQSRNIKYMEQITKDLLIEYGQELAGKVESGHMAVRTAQNYVAAVNRVLGLARRDTRLWISPTQEGGIAKKSGIATHNKATAEDEVLATRPDLSPRTAILIRLAHAWGLRFKECCLLNARQALAEAQRHQRITVTLGTKGGRRRTVPMTSEEQLSVLEEAARIQEGRSMVPPHLSFIEFATTAYREYSRYHGGRHQYAQRRYLALVGAPCPIAAGVAHGDDHIEPPREFRRLFGVSHAAVAGSVSLR